MPPDDDGWRMTGICADVTQFAKGQMLLARAGKYGLGPSVIGKLHSRSVGIIAESAEAYVDYGVPVLEIANTYEAVIALAIAAREQFSRCAIGVTGSVGKTSTVAMAAHALSGVGKVDRSRTSANSPYGIAWNLASMDRDADFWVQEMAITKMEVCSQLVQPDVAIVTAIAPAHTSRFGSTDDIARLKARIYEGMAPGAIAVINGDMDEAGIFESFARDAGLRIVRFGESAGNDARLLGLERSIVHAEIFGKTCSFVLGAPGRHMAMNALAVLAAIAATGRPIEAAAARLESFKALPGRGRRSHLIYEGKAIEVWDEAFNANPASMRAALRVMQDAEEIPAKSRVLVLGDMLELGADTQELHLALEADIRVIEPDRILFCGPHAAAREAHAARFQGLRVSRCAGAHPRHLLLAEGRRRHPGEEFTWNGARQARRPFGGKHARGSCDKSPCSSCNCVSALIRRSQPPEHASHIRVGVALDR